MQSSCGKMTIYGIKISPPSPPPTRAPPPHIQQHPPKKTNDKTKQQGEYSGEMGCVAESHEQAAFVTTKHGGHLGFFESGFIRPHPISWIDRFVCQVSDAIIVFMLSQGQQVDPGAHLLTLQVGTGECFVWWGGGVAVVIYDFGSSSYL